MELNQGNNGLVTSEGQKEFKRPAVISFSSIKGGIGKTHSAILTDLLAANLIAAIGKKVLVIDIDHNNQNSYQWEVRDDHD
jgi:cellulose biosynthesis protein BcsQ